MTSDDQIADLIKRVEHLEHQVQTTNLVRAYIDGQLRARSMALEAIVETHPRPDLLEVLLHRKLAVTEAGAVAEVPSEAYLNGYQAEHNVLLLTFKEAKKAAAQRDAATA